jgi:membrane-bound lytic murein transglycosylase D
MAVSYNHGINGMATARRQYGSDIGKIVRNYKGRLFGFASRNFYAEFLAVRSIIHDLDRYFPGGVLFDRPIDHDRVHLMVPATLPQLAGQYGVHTGLVQALNPALTQRAVNGRAPLPAGTEIWLPKHRIPDSRFVTLHNRKQETFPIRKPAFRASETGKRVAKRTLVKKPGKKTGSRRSKTHVVRKGESAFRIASRYGVQVRTMMAFNDLRPNAVIRPGQELRIPLK